MQANKPPQTTMFYYSWKSNYEGFPGVGYTCWLPIDTSQENTEIIGDLQIGKKVFHDVFNATVTFPTSYNDTVFDGLAYPLHFYFSPGYGVIKMDFSDSTSLELESIEW